MAEEFKEEVFVKVGLNLKSEHREYLQSLKNGSKYLRWLIDNDAGYIKFMKEKPKTR